jgi:erythronate-4-phosphate dehydrogenase
MTIVVDENIPYAAEAFGRFGEIRTVAGRAITRETLADAEALVVRSITRVDRKLLESTPVRFVGTATNGIDHVDVNYLAGARITFAAAVASNANAVAEYVLAALLELRARGLTSLAGARLGIVGVGAIGSLLEPRAAALGMEVVPYDPPRARVDPAFSSAAYEDLFNCDILTFHVPLVTSGLHPTLRMVDGALLERLRPETLIINSSRGDVVDSAALLAALRDGRIRAAVLDVWEGEPAIPVELIERVTLASPHIAAYSIDAKLRGTEMMAEALARFTGTERAWRAADVLPNRVGEIALTPGIAPLDAAALAVRTAFDITRDDGDVRALLTLSEAERRAGFDLLRKNYRMRREFPAFGFAGGDPDVRSLLSALGFASSGRKPA